MNRFGSLRAVAAWLLASDRRLRRRRMALAVAILLFLLWAFVGGSDGLYVQARMSSQISDLRRGNVRLELMNELMRGRIQRLSVDMAYIERIARERYGMARPNERVYRVLPTVDSSGTADENR